MQITLKWTCRECAADQETLTDTSNYGVLCTSVGGPTTQTESVVSLPYLMDLRCSACGHVSGEVGLGYRFREAHRPSHER